MEESREVVVEASREVVVVESQEEVVDYREEEEEESWWIRMTGYCSSCLCSQIRWLNQERC